MLAEVSVLRRLCTWSRCGPAGGRLCRRLRAGGKRLPQAVLGQGKEKGAHLPQVNLWDVGG